jgi:hypothetical protein
MPSPRYTIYRGAQMPTIMSPALLGADRYPPQHSLVRSILETMGLETPGRIVQFTAKVLLGRGLAILMLGNPGAKGWARFPQLV